MATAKKKFAPHEAEPAAEEVAGPSNRSFGLVVGGIFLLIAGLRYGLFGHAGPFTTGMSVLGGLLVLFGAIAPDALTLPNRLWMKLGFLLGLIMTPIVMGLLYLLTFIPMGLALRLAGKDPLRRRKKGEGESYWVVRDPAGPDPKTMTNQF